jgi:hypothetical protein
MRHGFLGLVFIGLTPLAAQAGDAFSVPPSGVLAPPRPVASLYDDSTMSTGKPVEARGAIEARPAATAKPKARHATAGIRSSLAPYVRRSKRPPASLPPGIVAPQPYRPAAAYQPPAPLPLQPAPVISRAQPANTATPPARGFLGSTGSVALFSSDRAGASLAPAVDNRFTNRGLFTGSIAQPARPAYPPQQVMPLPPGQPIY